MPKDQLISDLWIHMQNSVNTMIMDTIAKRAEPKSKVRVVDVKIAETNDDLYSK